ncbi:hypothetical protein CLIB1444_02S17524 [[Candida] jaroonii]|uniref:Uncharacterized protein n=1 Tax=[Candida] jaroonii TaxID=467808 RepID=A0ACA9Y4J7_9ASCO|nr:hypothetical protein CLIB1444_02S17524 [[Candida] jaroonii]
MSTSTSNNSGVNGLKFHLLVNFFLLLQLVCGANINQIQSSDDNIEWSSVQKDDMFHFLDNNTLIEVIEVNDQNQDNSGKLLSRRINCPSIAINYKQYQLVQHGTWWSSWERFAYRKCAQSSPFSNKVDWTIGYDFATDAGISFSKVAQLLSGAGVSIVKKISTDIQLSCNCQGTEPVCMWEQSRLTWSDTQVQTCTRYSNCEGGYVECQPWSKYQRTNAPLKNDITSFNFGCSVGSAC